jgi:hypothetical protein
MTVPIPTVTDEPEAPGSMSTSADRPNGYSATADELFADMIGTWAEANEQTRPQDMLAASESEPANTQTSRTPLATMLETSYKTFAAVDTPREPYDLKQKWEGYVLEVGQETFRARLTAIAGEPGQHIANIYLAEVDNAEKDLVKPGSIFYWSIGYRDLTSGRRRESFIRFQRLPYRSERDFVAARQRGRELLQLFRGE